MTPTYLQAFISHDGQKWKRVFDGRVHTQKPGGFITEFGVRIPDAPQEFQPPFVFEKWWRWDSTGKRWTVQSALKNW